MLRRLEVKITAPNEKIADYISSINTHLVPHNIDDNSEIIKCLALAITAQTDIKIEGSCYSKGLTDGGTIELTKALCYPVRFPWDYTEYEKALVYDKGFDGTKSVVKDTLALCAKSICEQEVPVIEVDGRLPSISMCSPLSWEHNIAPIVRALSPTLEFMADEDINESMSVEGNLLYQYLSDCLANTGDYRAHIDVITTSTAPIKNARLGVITKFPWECFGFLKETTSNITRKEAEHQIRDILGDKNAKITIIQFSNYDTFDKIVPRG